MEVESDRFSSWLYNVRDEYKPKTKEEICEDLAKNALPCSVLMAHLQGDFNFGTVVRTANAYNLRNVFYYGRKRYDRRGAQGTYHYTNVVYLPTFDQVMELKQQYRFVGLENNIKKSPVDLRDYVWQPNSLVVIGEEGQGLQDNILELCDDLVEIKMFGSVRSLNAGVAAGIAMDRMSQHLRGKNVPC